MHLFDFLNTQEKMNHTTYFLFHSPISKWLFLLLLCCIGNASQAQNFLQDSLLAKEYVAKAASCFKIKQIDSAKMWHRQALDLFQKHKMTKRWYGSYRNLADTLVKYKQPFMALEYLDSVIRVKKSATREEDELRGVMGLCLHRGYICQRWTGDLEGAKEYYEEAFQILVADLSENEKDVSMADWLYRALGNIYSRLGDYESAQNTHQRAIDYGKRIGRPDIGKYGDLAIALNDLGRYEDALKVVEEGLAVPNLPLNALITTRLSEAAAWLGMGDTQKALEASEKVPALIEQLQSQDDKNYYSGGYHTRLGDIESKMGDLESAIENYRKAVELETLSSGANSREVAKNYYALGECFFQKKEFRKALEAYQQTLQAVLPDFQPQNVQENPSSNLFEKAENTIIQGLEGKAQCFEALDNLDKALECYERIPSVEAKLLATHTFEKSSLLAVEISRPRFDKAIGLAWMLYERTNNIDYARRAFHLSEQARGILLMKTIAQAQASYKLADSVRRSEYEFKVRLSWLENEIAQEQVGSERFRALENELFLLKQKQIRFRADLAGKDPIYANLSKNISFLTASDVSDLLRPGQAFINYYLAEKTAYAFLLDAQGNLVWKKTDLPERFRDSIMQRFVDFLANGRGGGDEKSFEESLAEDKWLKQNAFVLYELLLAPVLAAAPTQPSALVVAPDEVLAFLPFDLLQYEASQGEWSDAGFPFLLRKFSISYVYSATVLSRQQQGTREHRSLARLTFAGFAPAYSGRERDPQNPQKILNSISGQQQLAQTVQQMFGGKIFINELATEEEFERTAPTCRMLLLAMHGFAHEEKPALSRLIFSHPKKDNDPDNVLYTEELQITYLPADLVVLNACYSGRGKLQRGEGVYSMTRALTSAGVSAAVMSVWELNGASSAELMLIFFQNIKNGMPKDLALQQAKIKFLENPDNELQSHPSFWAGILATGDASALKF
jgi:CHAT domain-containing protein/tetratricopeptide (TPR) repeat protein